YNPCKLLDFSLLVLKDGESHSGQSADREVLAVILGGKADFEIGGTTFENVGGRPNVFAGKPHSVYIPAGSSYTITGAGPVQIALSSAPSDLKTDPYVIGPCKVTTGVWGAANFTRNFHQILTATSQPDLPAQRLIVGETFTPSGNWSTYPAHKHEVDNLPKEAYHEETYFFKVSPPDGFGITRHYGEGYEDNHTVRDNTILMIPHGYHTYVGAPGYTSYYLWSLAGEHRTQAVTEDSATGWVGRTVPMLRALGH
ncbi:MAG: 5-deoxy-glucuronate isomerase, partial [Anaerolineae bacterium]|nr:5-deoxy-glucuronate isomerase [Anaerolineae bacterium]